MAGCQVGLLVDVSEASEPRIKQVPLNLLLKREVDPAESDDPWGIFTFDSSDSGLNNKENHDHVKKELADVGVLITGLDKSLTSKQQVNTRPKTPFKRFATPLKAELIKTPLQTIDQNSPSRGFTPGVQHAAMMMAESFKGLHLPNDNEEQPISPEDQQPRNKYYSKGAISPLMLSDGEEMTTSFMEDNLQHDDTNAYGKRSLKKDTAPFINRMPFFRMDTTRLGIGKVKRTLDLDCSPEMPPTKPASIFRRPQFKPPVTAIVNPSLSTNVSPAKRTVCNNCCNNNSSRGPLKATIPVTAMVKPNTLGGTSRDDHRVEEVVASNTCKSKSARRHSVATPLSAVKSRYSVTGKFTHSNNVHTGLPPLSSSKSSVVPPPTTKRYSYVRPTVSNNLTLPFAPVGAPTQASHHKQSSHPQLAMRAPTATNHPRSSWGRANSTLGCTTRINGVGTPVRNTTVPNTHGTPRRTTNVPNALARGTMSAPRKSSNVRVSTPQSKLTKQPVERSSSVGTADTVRCNTPYKPLSKVRPVVRSSSLQSKENRP